VHLKTEEKAEKSVIVSWKREAEGKKDRRIQRG
jgi:hypothetical protein